MKVVWVHRKDENRFPVRALNPPQFAGLAPAKAVKNQWVVQVLVSPAVAGEVYTWTDSEGNIHKTHRPPNNS